MGRAGDTIDNVDTAGITEIWARVSGNQPFPANTLLAVNMEYAGLDQQVKDGDELAFFPPVTGG